MSASQPRIGGRFGSLAPSGLAIADGECYCRECKRVMPYAAFLPHYTKRTRRTSVCRECLPLARGPRRPKKVRPGGIPISAGQRWCASCETVKSADDFHRGSTYCKPCHLDSNRRSLYGISRGEYELLYQKQDGKCAICGQACSHRKDKLSVDHDHGSGRVRGLLCSDCNKGIGIFRDDVARLSAAIDYLRSHSAVRD